MYAPPHFRVEDRDRLRRLIEERPLATLVSAGPGGLAASHLPMLLEEGDAGAPEGRLLGHLARPNPQAGALLDAEGGTEVLAVFRGEAGYVSPSWYASKREHGKVVPTWNYVAVHARGRARSFTEPERLRALVERLTERAERASEEPWSVDDAPADFTAKMLRGIVGVEVALTALEGAWKLGQNRPEADRRGVVEGLRGRGDAESLALARRMIDAEG